ncbi:MAG: hypothetical protein JWQ02_4595 [Capsulimonas sp.]|nr:hypothetical protein [Capsulimonas sp.]
MPPKTIVSSSVTELALALRERSVSSEEIVSATLARLLEVNPLLNAAIRIAPESAIAQARAADIALGRGDLALVAAHCIESACGGWQPPNILPVRTT